MYLYTPFAEDTSVRGTRAIWDNTITYIGGIKMSYRERSPLDSAKGAFRRRWGLLTERLVWLEILARLLFARDFKGLKEAFWDLDGYLGTKQITADSISSEEEREQLAKMAGGALVGFFLFLSTSIVVGLLVSIFWRGPAPALGPQVLPPVPTTPTAITFVDVWAPYDKLNQSEARELRSKANVLNVAILDGGGATYLRDYGLRFDPASSEWSQNNQPFGLTNMSVAGTTVNLGADNQVYTLNMYQGFVRIKDPTTLYLVDSQGHIWMAKLSQQLLERLDQLHPPVEIAPNPNLTFTY